MEVNVSRAAERVEGFCGTVFGGELDKKMTKIFQ